MFLSPSPSLDATQTRGVTTKEGSSPPPHYGARYREKSYTLYSLVDSRRMSSIVARVVTHVENGAGAVIFIARMIQHFLPSSTRVEMCL